MNRAVPAPDSFDSLQKAIIERFPSLSKRLQQIASYALENPSELALETIAAVAQRAGVQPSGLIRFAKVFGFSGYSDMQRVFRLRLTDALPDYKERLRSLRRDAAGEEAEDVASLLEHFVQADIVGLQCLTQQGKTAQQLEQALTLIADSEIVYLVAHRRSFPVCFYLAYALSRMNVRNVLVDGVGGMFFQQVSHARPNDVIFAVSSKAYSPDVVQAVRESAQRGVPVIALTDSPLSPLVEHSKVSIEVQDASVHMFRSLAVPMTIAITLIVGLGRVLEARKGTRVTSKRPKRAARN